MFHTTRVINAKHVCINKPVRYCIHNANKIIVILWSPTKNTHCGKRSACWLSTPCFMPPRALCCFSHLSKEATKRIDHHPIRPTCARRAWDHHTINLSPNNTCHPRKKASYYSRTSEKTHNATLCSLN